MESIMGQAQLFHQSPESGSDQIRGERYSRSILSYGFAYPHTNFMGDLYGSEAGSALRCFQHHGFVCRCGVGFIDDDGIGVGVRIVQSGDFRPSQAAKGAQQNSGFQILIGTFRHHFLNFLICWDQDLLLSLLRIGSDYIMLFDSADQYGVSVDTIRNSAENSLAKAQEAMDGDEDAMDSSAMEEAMTAVKNGYASDGTNNLIVYKNPEINQNLKTIKL